MQPVSIQFHDLHPPENNFLDDVLSGLLKTPRIIPPKYFYDQSDDYNPFFIQLSESHFSPQMKWQLQATSDYGHLYTLMIIALLIILLAAVIALSMKIVGVLLISALLIMPAAAARRFSTGPEQMAVLAALIGVLAVIGGLFGSLQWDTPAGPSIVVVALLLFLIGLMPPTGRAAKSRKETS